MTAFLSLLKRMFSVLPEFSFQNFLEVLIISFVIYEILILIKNSHAFTLLKGIAVIAIFIIVSAVLHLDNILWILEKISTVSVIALVVIFQPELRKGLDTLGRQKFMPRFVSFDTKDSGQMTEDTVKEIAIAVFEMARVKTGALIVLEQSEDLSDYINSGIMIDGIVSSALLINIFEKNTPLHDGAVVIRGNAVLAATCYLPLSDNEKISKALGTRHRAAIGMSEATDSITIVVSEETGIVTVARDGKLSRVQNTDHLISMLSSLPREKSQRRRSSKNESKEAVNGK